MSLVDILFVVTIALLVFNGLRNGFVFSLVNLLSLPIAFGVAWLFGPRFTQILASANLPSNPLLAYIVLFFGTVLIIHVLASSLRVVRKLPVIGAVDTLLGGVVGFVEAWLLWVVFLLVLHNFLQDTSQVQQLGISTSLFHSWQQFYDDAVSNSLFAKVNGVIIQTVPLIHVPK